MGEQGADARADDPAMTAARATSFLLGEAPSLTRVEVAERAGVPLDLAVTLWRQLGFPHRADDDVAFVEGDVEALRLSAELVRIGILSPESQAALVRTWGRSYARLAEWQTSLLAGLAVERRPDPEAGLAELAADVLPARRGAAELRLAPTPRQRGGATCSTTRARLTATESQLSVCFVDIVGYTTQSRSLDGAALVQWVDGFEQETTALVVDHGGQVIKTIGDEVLFTVADPAAAVRGRAGAGRPGRRRGRPLPGGAGRHRPRARRTTPRRRVRLDGQRRLPPDLGRPTRQRAGRRGRPRGAQQRGRRRGDEDDMARPPWRFRRARRIPAKGFTHLRPGACGHGDGQTARGGNVKARSLLTGETTTTGQRRIYSARKGGHNR